MLDPKASNNSNKTNTEAPPSEHNNTNPVIQYSNAISFTE